MGLIEDILKTATGNTVYEDDIGPLTSRHNAKIAEYNARINKEIQYARDTGEDRTGTDELKPYAWVREVMAELETMGYEVVRRDIQFVPDAPVVDMGRRKRDHGPPPERKRRVGPAVSADVIVREMLASKWSNVIDTSSMTGTAREQIALRTQAAVSTSETVTLGEYNLIMARVMVGTYDGYRYGTRAD